MAREQFLLRSGIAFTFRSDLADHDVAGNYVCSDADNSSLVEVFGCILAHIRYVACELLHSALGLTHLKSVFVYMHGSKDILAHHALVEHNGVLIVIPFPRA